MAQNPHTVKWADTIATRSEVNAAYKRLLRASEEHGWAERPGGKEQLREFLTSIEAKDLDAWVAREEARMAGSVTKSDLIEKYTERLTNAYETHMNETLKPEKKDQLRAMLGRVDTEEEMEDFSAAFEAELKTREPVKPFVPLPVQANAIAQFLRGKGILIDPWMNKEIRQEFENAAKSGEDTTTEEFSYKVIGKYINKPKYEGKAEFDNLFGAWVGLTENPSKTNDPAHWSSEEGKREIWNELYEGAKKGNDELEDAWEAVRVKTGLNKFDPVAESPVVESPIIAKPVEESPPITDYELEVWQEQILEHVESKREIDSKERTKIKADVMKSLKAVQKSGDRKALEKSIAFLKTFHAASKDTSNEDIAKGTETLLKKPTKAVVAPPLITPPKTSPAKKAKVETVKKEPVKTLLKPKAKVEKAVATSGPKTELQKAREKAKAWWALHPSGMNQDMAHKAKAVVKTADKYQPSRNDFKGVDDKKYSIVRWK